MARQPRPFEIKHHLRIIALILLVIIMFIAAAMRAFQFQIVEGEKYLQTAQKSSDVTISIMAARGNIIDSKGVPFTHNKAIFNVEFDYSFLRAGTENDIIIRLIELFIMRNEEWVDDLPISKTQPYAFVQGRESDIAKLKKKFRLNDYATADECMVNIYREFGIKKFENDKGRCTHCGKKVDSCDFSDYSEIEARRIAGVRYQMVIADFSTRNRYTFAEDIEPTTVSLLREFSNEFRGMFVVERANRTYVSGDIASHLIGTIGPIYAEELDKYVDLENLSKSEYLYTDLVGKSGIEKAAEKDLKGKNGKLQMSLDADGNIIESLETVTPIQGNTLQLTLNYKLQEEVQRLLAEYITTFNETNKDNKFSESAAVVILDVKTGGVLASVSYPYYDIDDYINNYSEVLNRPGKPLNNKALQGSYRPGSTFKPIVAAAALSEGLINPTSNIFCTFSYQFWGTGEGVYQPKCLSIGHGRQNLNVSEALQHSCNIFFYDTGRRLGIDTINKYAQFFGLGTDTGLEIPNSNGNLSSKEYSQSKGVRWEQGNVVQAAVGQQDTGVTPLQLAIEAMTIANKGKRLNAHLIKAYISPDGEDVISEVEPSIASEFHMTDETYTAITNGMIAAANGIGYPNQVNDFGFDVAIKTGTPEITKERTNSDFIAFFPVDDPKIAISCMVEDGKNSNQLLRRLIEAYNKTK